MDSTRHSVIHTFPFQIAFVILVEEPAFSLIKAGEFMEMSILRFSSLSEEKVQVRVKIDF